MPRYIDADKLKETLKDLEVKPDIRETRAIKSAINVAFPQIIDDEPTADVAPVIHAHWEYFKIESKCKLPFSNFDMECSLVDSGWKCSNCNIPLGFLNHSENLKLDSAYCPHCGAKMDEEEKHGKI